MRNHLFLAVAASAFAMVAAIGAGAQTTDADVARSRLADYPGFGHDPVADSRAHVADYAKRQSLVAACMRDAGFRYTPATATAVRQNEARQSSRSAGRAQDPNEAYVSSLSEDERLRYNMALYGIPDPNDENMPEEQILNASGCYPRIAREYTGVFEGIRGIEDDYWNMRLSVRQMPDVRAVNAEWASCMNGKGVAVPSFEALIGAETSQGVPPPPGTEAVQLAPADLAAAKEASATCKTTVNFDQRLARARVAAENAFADKHKSRLDAFLTRRRAQ